jgi:Arc/MetJ-type ribon-helix-helix transcriptional regulator
VQNGSFADAAEVVRVALREFISHWRHELPEQRQLEDIAFSVREKR